MYHYRGLHSREVAFAPHTKRPGIESRLRLSTAALLRMDSAIRVLVVDGTHTELASGKLYCITIFIHVMVIDDLVKNTRH